MKSVTGQFREYSLTKKVRSGADGDVWLIAGGESEGICAKLVKGRSGAMQSEVEASLQGAGNGSLLDTPIDIAFSRGKFAGYIYYDAAAYADPVSSAGTAGTGGRSGQGGRSGLGGSSLTHLDTASYDSDMGGMSDSSSGRGGIAGSPVIRMAASAAAIVLIALLNIQVFHDIYLNLIEASSPEDVLTGCMALSFSGITAVIVGLVAAFFAGRIAKESDTPVFAAVIAVGMLAGIILADIAIFILVRAFLGAVSLLMAFMPVLIIILGIIYVIRKVLK